jgi:hypothetical protein
MNERCCFGLDPQKIVEPLRSTESPIPAESINEFLRHLSVFESAVVDSSEDVALDSAVIAGFDGLSSLIHDTSNWKALLTDGRPTGEVGVGEFVPFGC